MGRAAQMACQAAIAALAQSRLERRDIAVVAGSGAGDVATHIEIQERLASPGGMRWALMIAFQSFHSRGRSLMLLIFRSFARDLIPFSATRME